MAAAFLLLEFISFELSISTIDSTIPTYETSGSITVAWRINSPITQHNLCFSYDNFDVLNNLINRGTNAEFNNLLATFDDLDIRN